MYEIINVETLCAWLDQKRPVTVLDVRPTADRHEWWIPESMHVDAYAALRAHDRRALSTVKLPENIPVVTVCRSGLTSLIAAEQLSWREIEAYSLEGGMKAWSLAWNSATVPYEEHGARIIQLRRTGKGCLSYLIGAGKEAFVIDASLDPQIYLNLAARLGWSIRGVLDTHIHADHLSRSRQLADSSGAILFLPEQQRVAFPFTPLCGKDILPIAGQTLRVLHTPGHTTESVCYLLNDRVLFTGDTLALTGVGRPDLQSQDVGEARVNASLLYSSIHILLSLPEETLVLPGHTGTPVAFDGCPIMTTLSAFEQHVSIVRANRDDFVLALLYSIPHAPLNYRLLVKLNEKGLMPDSDITELEAGANRCVVS